MFGSKYLVLLNSTDDIREKPKSLKDMTAEFGAIGSPWLRLANNRTSLGVKSQEVVS
jgi:hypothetical protein